MLSGRVKLILAISWLTFIVDVQRSGAVQCGQELVPYRGVTAFYNGPNWKDSCLPYGQYGYPYQCVEYVRRFYAQALGVDTSKANGWGGNAKDFYSTATAKGLLRFANGQTSVPPQAEDIIVFGGSKTNAYGHVAIVTSVSGNRVDLIEQNWSPTGKATVFLSQDSQTHYWSIANRKGLPVLGWLRLKQVDSWTRTSGPDPDHTVVVQAIGATSSRELFATSSRSCQNNNALGVFYSTDRGTSWTPITNGLASTNVRSLTVTRDGDVLAGTHNGVSRLNGARDLWSASGLQGVDVNVLVATAEAIWAADSCFCTGLRRSTDNGRTWLRFDAGLPRCVNAVVRHRSGDVYAGTGTSGVYRLAFGGLTWTPFNADLTTLDVHSLATDSAGNLFVGTIHGLFRWREGEDHWTPLSNGLPSDGIQSIAVSPSGVVFVGTFRNGIYVSADSGATWTERNFGISDTTRTVGVISFDGDGFVYASVGGVVYRSTAPVR